MALASRYVRTVVFVLGGGGGDDLSPQGTGFVAGVLTEDPGIVIPFVVTAAHVVRPFVVTAVRLTRRDGTVEDRRISRWTMDDVEDVAVALLEDIDLDEIDLTAIPVDQFVGQRETEFPVGFGDTVYFGGLLGKVESMGARNVPMVRAGSVGALHQVGVPMRLLDDTVVHVRGHLIDCRSFGGFSGSPCFVRYISDTHTTERLKLQSPIESTLLLGMIGGHFDDSATVKLPGDAQTLAVPVSAGIAVVYTADVIKQTLDDAWAALRE